MQHPRLHTSDPNEYISPFHTSGAMYSGDPSWVLARAKVPERARDVPKSPGDLSLLVMIPTNTPLINRKKSETPSPLTTNKKVPPFYYLECREEHVRKFNVFVNNMYRL